MNDDPAPGGPRSSRILRRVPIAIIVTVAVVLLALKWIVPVALSFDAARTAPPTTRIVPIDLPDKSVSQQPGIQLSYFGYEFEVPWADLDVTQTVLYPKDKLNKTSVRLQFRSGLRMLVSMTRPRELVGEFRTKLTTSPASQKAFESVFGPGTSQSDYRFMKAVYEFSPEKMHHWTPSSQEQLLLLIKMIAVRKAGETGIFNLQNSSLKGFQQGSPQARPDSLVLSLFSDDGGIEFIVSQKDYQGSTPVTQAEINRIVQSLRRVS